MNDQGSPAPVSSDTRFRARQLERGAKLPLAQIKPESDRERMRMVKRTLFYFAKGSIVLNFVSF